jgi:hypothetical protein
VTLFFCRRPLYCTAHFVVGKYSKFAAAILILNPNVLCEKLEIDLGINDVIQVATHAHDGKVCRRSLSHLARSVDRKT